jgi:chromosome segregation ATPase
MANAVRTKLQRISGQYSAKVADIRKLEADKRKPFVTDAQVKKINEQINKLDRERLKINAELTKLTKLAKTAEEYTKLNDKLKSIQASITKAETRGESTTSFKQERNSVLSRLKTISPDVEANFPEIRVALPTISTTSGSKPGPTGTPAVKTGPTGTQPKVVTTGTPYSAKNRRNWSNWCYRSDCYSWR